MPEETWKISIKSNLGLNVRSSRLPPEQVQHPQLHQPSVVALDELSPILIACHVKKAKKNPKHSLHLNVQHLAPCHEQACTSLSITNAV